MHEAASPSLSPSWASAFPLSLNVEDHGQPTATLLLDVVVRGVVRDVAMHQPLARLPCLPDHVPALSRPDVDRVREIPSRRRKRDAVEPDDLERTSVDVHRINAV